MKKTSSSKTRTGKIYLIYARVSPKGSQWDAQETSIKVQLHEWRILYIESNTTQETLYDFS